MRFRAITPQNVANFFPTQKWQDEISCALFSDINPESADLLPNGTEVMFPFDDRVVFGTVVSVSGRRATIFLDEMVAGQNILTVNWAILRLADERYRNREEKEKKFKDSLAQKRTEEIRLFVQKIKQELKNEETHFDVSLQETIPVSDFIEKQKMLIDYVEQMNLIKNIVVDIYNELKSSKNELIKQGVPENDLPELPNISEDIIHLSRFYRKKQNDQIRKKLASVRSITRTLLVKTLLHAGEEGLSSEQIIRAICDDPNEKDDAPRDVTPHRVMGMLSALSRNRQVLLNDNNFWVATETLTNNDMT